MYNNKKDTSFSPIMGGGNYNLEYVNEGYASIQPIRAACSNNGCGGTCHGTAGNSCSANCGGACSSSCTGGCIGGCGFGCGGACTYGCGGCGSCGGCDTGCSNTCKNTCTGGCTGSGSTVSINGVAKTCKFYIGINNVIKQSTTQYASINGVIKQV